jgi:BirA family biotin operon repressor/biotin-[acetyl-CoA-carboxylase] ligase
MPSIAIPSILDRIACAADAGIANPEADPERQELLSCIQWGYPIEVREGRARLGWDCDCLIPSWIVKETPSVVWESLRVEGFLETESTNAEALERARRGAPAGTLIYAESQTAGRGRNRRRWISPSGAGLYFSLLLRPIQPVNRWSILTHAASVAVALTLRELSDASWIPRPLDLELKWPNDVLCSGRKAAGILLETAGTAGTIEAVVIGVGINVKPGRLPGELADDAISISEAAGVQVPRRRLLVRFLCHFQTEYDLFQRGEHDAILEQWKSYSRMWRDTPVWIMDGEGPRPGVTAGLTESGALLVREPDGRETEIMAGDVSIRRAGCAGR